MGWRKGSRPESEGPSLEALAGVVTAGTIGYLAVGARQGFAQRVHTSGVIGQHRPALKTPGEGRVVAAEIARRKGCLQNPDAHPLAVEASLPGNYHPIHWLVTGVVGFAGYWVGEGIHWWKER